MSINVDLSVQKLTFPNGGANLLFHPIRMVVAGPSGSGKSWLIVKMIQHREQLFSTKFHRILYCVPSKMSQIHHHIFEEIKSFFPEAEFHLDLPKADVIVGDNLPKLIILDDMMQQIFTSRFMEDVFIQHSHHSSCSIIFTSQNFFSNSKDKTIVRQCNYKIIFQSPSDLVLLRHISCQLKPDDSNFLIKIFDSLEKLFPHDDFKYVLVDGEPRSKMKQLRVRTHILPNSEGRIEPLCFFSSESHKK